MILNEARREQNRTSTDSSYNGDRSLSLGHHNSLERVAERIARLQLEQELLAKNTRRKPVDQYRNISLEDNEAEENQ